MSHQAKSLSAPSALCIKESDIWKRAEEECEQMKGGAGSELAAQTSGWKTQISMNISLMKSKEYLQGRQLREYDPYNLWYITSVIYVNKNPPFVNKWISTSLNCC